MDINKIVIPAAGKGSKFAPYSKTCPREMLPLLNKPAIQYIAEEALQADITNMNIITARGKDVIADYFDLSDDNTLNTDDKLALTSVERLSRTAQFSYIRQAEALGTGHALWLARHGINKEYFAVAYPDDIIISKQSALAQLMRVARQEKASIIAVQEVPAECISSYGVIGIKKVITPNLFQVSHVVEKPQPKDAPSSLAIVGRYILSSKIFQSLEQMLSYENNELHLTEAIGHMMQHNERVFAYKVQGTRYDIGTPLGYIKAVIGTSMQDSEYSPSIKKFLTDFNSADSFLYNPAKIIEHTL